MCHGCENSEDLFSKMFLTSYMYGFCISSVASILVWGGGGGGGKTPKCTDKNYDHATYLREQAKRVIASETNYSNPIRCRLQSEGWRLWTSILFCSGLRRTACSHTPSCPPLYVVTPDTALSSTASSSLYNPFQNTFRMFWCLLTWPKYLSFLDSMSFIRDLVTFRWLRTYWFVLFSICP